MQLRKLLFATIIILLNVSVFHAQDQHFTQFYASPLTLNPALTGAMDGSFRIGLNYREQGRSEVEVPYSTASAALDLRLGLDSRKRARADKFGVGMVFYSDRSPFVNFFTNHIAVSAGFHKALSKDEDQFLSIGFQGGITQRNVNYDNFTFEDQFNGSSGYNLPTEEILPTNNFSFSDLAVGLQYAYTPKDRMGIYLGGSMFHVLEPQVSFYQEAQVANDNRLFRKYIAHLGLRIPMGDLVQLLPRAIGYLQGPHLSTNVGTNFRFEFGNNNSALHLGGWGRFTNNTASGITWDAGIFMAGIEYNGFLVGFSYDAKVLSFTSGGNVQSALEFSLTYIGNYDNSNISFCPSF